MQSLIDYDFSLPEELIATYPLKKRDSSRLMCLMKGEEKPRHDFFINIDSYLEQGDVLVLNNTKVMKARINAFKTTGGKVEILLVSPVNNNTWMALLKGKNIDNNAILQVPYENSFYEIKVVKKDSESGHYLIECSDNLLEISEKIGSLPLPPYFHREASLEDNKSYQTIFAKEMGAVAAPTAGLHFSEEILSKLKKKGVKIAEITLHVGPGTFMPIRCEDIEQHEMHSEFFRMDQACANVLNEAKKNHKRIIPVGSTSMRVIEQVMQWAKARKQNNFFACSDKTNIFIRPGYQFLASSAMITNFHLPKSTLIILVSALAGKDKILNAYKEAIQEKYRFFSYGDACFIENKV